MFWSAAIGDRRDARRGAHVGSDRIEVTDASPEQIGTLAAVHRIPVFEITEEHPSLEEMFLQLTGARPLEEDRR